VLQTNKAAFERLCCFSVGPLDFGTRPSCGTGFSREEAWVTDITFAV